VVCNISACQFATVYCTRDDALKSYFHPVTNYHRNGKTEKNPIKPPDHSLGRTSGSGSVSQALKTYFPPDPDVFERCVAKWSTGEKTADCLHGRSFSESGPSHSSRNQLRAYPLARTYNITSETLPPLRSSKIKSDVMANWLYAQQVENLWNQGTFEESVVLKKTRNYYTSCPREVLGSRNGLYDAVCKLNVRVGMKQLRQSPVF
jgi:hypothetical protein